MNTKTYFELLDKVKIAKEAITDTKVKYYNYIETPVIGEDGRWLLSEDCQADYEDIIDAFAVLQRLLNQFEAKLLVELVEEFRNVESNSQ